MIADLRNGVIDAMVVQDPYRMGFESVKTLVDKLNGKTPPAANRPACASDHEGGSGYEGGPAVAESGRAVVAAVLRPRTRVRRSPTSRLTRTRPPSISNTTRSACSPAAIPRRLRRNPAHPRRIDRRHHHRVAQTHARQPHHIAHRAVHRQRRSRQSRAAAQSHALIRVEFHLHFAQHVRPRFASRGHHRIGHQHRPARFPSRAAPPSETPRPDGCRRR